MESNERACPTCNGSGKMIPGVSEIAERRINLKLSRYGLAAASGISNVTIRNIEVGATKPRVTTIQTLKETLDRLERGDVSSVDRTWILRRRGDEESGVDQSDEETAIKQRPESREATREGSPEPARRIFYEAEAEDDWAEEVEAEDGE